MEKVPDIISTKDLDYLSDMLNWDYILIKKFNTYLEEDLNDDIKKVITKALSLLKKNYNELLSILEGGKN